MWWRFAVELLDGSGIGAFEIRRYQKKGKREKHRGIGRSDDRMIGGSEEREIGRSGDRKSESQKLKAKS
jgi:hypothetical protein